MKIMSENERFDNDDCGCREEHHHEKHCVVKCMCHEGPRPGKAILKCGCNGGAAIPKVEDDSIGNMRPIPLASVTIDPSNLKCPTTLLTFTAEINSVEDAKVELSFFVKKSSRNGCCDFICGSHTFSDREEDEGTKSFSFQVCDCNSCDDCVTYTVEFVPIHKVEKSGASICNAVLTALAVENICN